MEQDKARPWRWTAQRRQAAVLVAEDRLTDEKIAATLGIGRTTLHTWRQHPEFAARVAELVGDMAAVVQTLAIADRHRRVADLDDVRRRLLQVLAERAGDGEMADVPGGTSGVLTHTIKIVGVGQNAERVDEYAVDTALLRELRATSEQAAKELGQWSEKVDHSGSVIVRKYIGIDPSEV